MTAIGIIPARWASTRFPGKMLAPLAGKPLVQWVFERARSAERLDSVIVATDDERIRDVMRAAGGDAVLTRADHPSGTDRVAEAAAGQGADIVINIQGDEPMVDPGLLNELVDTLAGDATWDMVTACTPITDEAERESASVVKVVFDRAGRALYFSRSVIPHVREKEAGQAIRAPLHWRHIGIYGYQIGFLEQLVATPPCATEQAEKLEQLRALHLGCRMKVIQTIDEGIGVDTPEDLECAEALFRKAGLA